MKYTYLTPTQKRIVDAMIEVSPALAYRDVITRVEVEQCWEVILANRKPDEKKIGYPSFITKGEKLGRGVYRFPGSKVVDTDDFYEELGEWGVAITNYKKVRTDE